MVALGDMGDFTDVSCGMLDTRRGAMSGLGQIVQTLPHRAIGAV